MLISRSRPTARNAFTVVELLVVLFILGILAGLLIPTISAAIKAARRGAHKLEIDTIAEAIEKYRNKYGDYPPDGSSWPIMERHLRKAFPQILQSELNLLNPSSLGSQGWIGNSWTPDVNVLAGIRNDYDRRFDRVMDPAEALVFFLGGFSSDPRRPFTGQGGPFITTGVPSGQTLQYNIGRTNSFFEFETERLTLAEATVPNPPPTMLKPYTVIISSDEPNYHGEVNDLLPVYLANGSGIKKCAPIVYFDSRTYWLDVNLPAFGPVPASQAPTSNYYQTSPFTATSATVITVGSHLVPAEIQSNGGSIFGSIRPLVSDAPRVPPSTVRVRPVNNLFVEEKRFQVISPGLDGLYGGRLIAEIPTAEDKLAIQKFPSGNSLVGTVADTYYFRNFIYLPPEPKLPNPPQPPRADDLYEVISPLSKYALDNCANFSARTFADGQP